MQDKKLRRPDGSYSGAVTHENIMAIFDGAGDFNRRELHIAGHTIYIFCVTHQALTAYHVIVLSKLWLRKA